jgi:hypothetical protein
MSGQLHDVKPLDLDTVFIKNPFGDSSSIDARTQRHNDEYDRAKKEAFDSVSALQEAIVAPNDWLRPSQRADTVNGYAMRLVHLATFRVKIGKQMVNLMRRHMQTLADTGDDRLRDAISWIEEDFMSFLRVCHLFKNAAELLKRAAITDSIHGITMFSQEATTLAEDRRLAAAVVGCSSKSECICCRGKEQKQQEQQKTTGTNTTTKHPEDEEEQKEGREEERKEGGRKEEKRGEEARKEVPLSTHEANARFNDFLLYFPRCEDISRTDGTSEEFDDTIRKCLLACDEVIKRQPVADVAISNRRLRYDPLAHSGTPTQKCPSCGDSKCKADAEDEKQGMEAFLDHLQCCNRETRFSVASKCFQLASREFDVWLRRFMVLAKILTKSMKACALAEPIWISVLYIAIAAQHEICSVQSTLAHLRTAIREDIRM